MKRAALGSVLLALGILIAGPATQAHAHADLILSTPDDGAELATVPTEVELTFSEDLLPETVVVSVEDSAGMVIRVLEYEVDGSDVLVTWPPGLSGTEYTVNYRVVSQDGHPVSGSLDFTVAGAPVATEASASPASVDPAAATAVGAVESASTGSAAPMAAIAAGLGVGIAVGFLFLVMRRRGLLRRARRPGPGRHAMTTAHRSTTAGLGTAPIALIAVALGALALVATAVGLVLAGGSYEPALPGLPDPGATVGWGAPVTRLLADLAAVATVGWLLAATFLDPSGKDGVVSPTGRRDLHRAAIAAAAWAVLALVQLFLELANVLGLPLAEAVSPTIVSTYANEIPTTRALLFMALLATVVCIGAIMTATTGSAAAWLLVAVAAAALPALAGHSSGLGDHALATTAGVAHVVAAVVWMGGLVALGVHAARRDMPLLRPVQRFSTIALVAILLLAASGAANAYTRLDNAGQLFTTGYGQVLITKTLLIVALGVLGWVIRGRIIGTLDRTSRAVVFARIAGLELLVMAIAVGLGVALASSPPPRVEVLLPTYGESLLGFPYPPAPPRRAWASASTSIRCS